MLHVWAACARAVFLKGVYGSTMRTSLRSTIHHLNDAVVTNSLCTASSELTLIILFANLEKFLIEMFGENVALKPHSRQKFPQCIIIIKHLKGGSHSAIPSIFC